MSEQTGERNYILNFFQRDPHLFHSQVRKVKPNHCQEDVQPVMKMTIPDAPVEAPKEPEATTVTFQFLLPDGTTKDWMVYQAHCPTSRGVFFWICYYIYVIYIVQYFKIFYDICILIHEPFSKYQQLFSEWIQMDPNGMISYLASRLCFCIDACTYLRCEHDAIQIFQLSIYFCVKRCKNPPNGTAQPQPKKERFIVSPNIPNCLFKC